VPYQISITRSGAKDLKKLPKVILERVDSAILALSENPRPSGVKKLTNTDSIYRVRVGDYRILYSICDRSKLVTIARVRHRKDSY